MVGSSLKQPFDLQRRTKILALGLFGVILIIIGQLFIIQVIQHDSYKQQAYNEQVAKFILPAKRGQIYAKEGDSVVPLVLNQPVYTAFADPQEVENITQLTDSIASIAPTHAVDGYKKQLNSKSLRYVVIAKKLSYMQAQQIKRKNIAGVGVAQEDIRVYPEGSLAGQILGYVNSDGKGQYGIEGGMEATLKGRDGRLQAVTDVRRIPLTVSRDDISQPAQNGKNLVLSIDRTIQSYVEQALKRGLDNVSATKGSVVVMNPQNGQVYAMANYPSYDPSQYNKVEDYNVFQNGVISEPYEVGSVMKTMSMGAGLDSGAVTVNSTFNDSTGCVQIDDRKICNVEEDPRTAGATMLDTLHYSLNTGVVHILKQMGGGRVTYEARQKLYSYYHDRYRFGMLTGIELDGESKGVVISPDEAEGNNVRYANMAFGQGMDITMLQMAAGFSSAINGGVYYQPSIVAGTMLDTKKISTKKPKILKTGVLSPAASNTLRSMIVQGRQLGVLGGKDPAGYNVGGKTGTSQIIDKKTGEYTNENSIGSYVGFGGNELPQYVIMVQVKDSKAKGYSGTTAAGPIFQDISNKMIEYLQIPPVR